MGGTSQSKDINYSTPIGEAKEGETRIYRRIGYEKELLTLEGKHQTVGDMHKHNFEKNPEKPYLGFRPVENGKIQERYDWLTYKEVEQKVKGIGSGLLNKDFVPEVNEYKDYKLRMVSIYSKNNVPMWLVDMASSIYKISIVSIYDTLGEGATRFVFNETGVTTCCLTCDKIKNLDGLHKKESLGKLKNLVILDEENLTEADKKILEGYSWSTLSDLIKNGQESPVEYPQLSSSDIFCFSYTSGTTGDPKGVMLSHGNVISCAYCADQIMTLDEYTYLSYLPIPHVYEKVLVMLTSLKGGKIGFYNGNVLELKTDLALLKPTIFASVPRLLNKFYEKMQAAIENQSWLKKTLLKRGIDSKLHRLRTTGDYTHAVYDKLFAAFREILGGKVKVMISGSAPLSKDVQEMFMVLMGAPLLNGYGQTEGMGAEFLTAPGDKEVGITGAPMSCLEYKLLDIPDMNYFSTDKDEEGRPAPRGEILVRGLTIFKEYYKQEAKTKETLDEDGFLHSGDVGVILPGTNALKIIDRRKNMFKLSQGEYIAPEKLEIGYKHTPGVDDIFVYGDSLKSALVSIVNIAPAHLSETAKELKIEGEPQQICNNEAVVKHYLKLLEDQAKKLKFSGLEKIKRLHIEPVPFADLDLLTTTFKLKRHEAKKHFADVLDSLYKTLD